MPSRTMTLRPLGHQSFLANALMMRSRMWSSSTVGSGISRARLATARSRLARDHRIVGHDLGDLAAVLMNKVGRRLTRAKKEFHQAAALALGADFAAAHEIAFRDDTETSFPAASTTGSPLMCRSSMRFAASKMVASGKMVKTGRVMI